MTTLEQLGAAINQELAIGYANGDDDALNIWREELTWSQQHTLLAPVPEPGESEQWRCVRCGQEFEESVCLSWHGNEPVCPEAERPGWADMMERYA